MANFFPNRLEVLENATVEMGKAMFNDLQALKIRINGHDEGLDILDKNFQHVLTLTSQNSTKQQHIL